MVLVASTGCLADGPETAETEQAVSVSSYVTGTCSTAVVLGLSKQIADQVSCDNPTGLVKFQPSTKIQLTSTAVLPYLNKNAANALANVSATVQVNSAFRTVAQQYLLYRWYQAGRCGISAAATPGRSNHESGRALDLQNYSSVRTAMSNRGWTWFGSGDPVHFDYLSAADIRGQDVKAFQELWNRNNTNDKISVDGVYGPQTEARVKAAPATGFALGATCGTAAAQAPAELVQVDGPDRVLPLAQAHYRITIQNGTDNEWSAGTELRLATAASSPLHDDSWLSANVITTLGNAVAAHGMAEVSFDVQAPAVTEETPFAEDLVLVDGGTQIGGVQLALTVVPDMTEPSSSDGENEYDQEVSGGCSTTGGSGSLGLALAALAVVFRFRRRR